MVDREKAPRTEGVNQRRKRTSVITPMARVGRAAWAGLWLWPIEEERPAGAGWAKGLVGRKVGRAESEEEDFFELEIGFWNLPRLWKFAQGKLGGILTSGFFLNSS
jgi:hypothetical protein